VRAKLNDETTETHDSCFMGYFDHEKKRLLEIAVMDWAWCPGRVGLVLC